MKQRLLFISFIFFVLTLQGSKCRVKTCPPDYRAYNLHHLTPKGFDHIFRGDFKSSGECSGCHHISAEKCGYVKIKKIKKKNKQGIFTAKISMEHNGIFCEKEHSTFFPQEWSIQHTLDKIEEAYQNSKLIQSEKRIGKTKEGITITLLMDKNNPTKIFNAYPVLEE
ncbi:MAG: EndoU domain-containing protein [Bacteroidia bacterium]|nr:EndoU domain-containing protein [Bacteroidia bacterium]